MERIADPLVSAAGRIYSLKGLKRLLGAVTKDGGIVMAGKQHPAGRILHSGKI